MQRLRDDEYQPGDTITSWQIPLSWWQNHTSSDLRYHVRLRVDDSAALNAAWHQLSQRYTAHDGEIWIGGAYLRRIDPETVEAVSGGEDALDSLEWAINDDLLECLCQGANAAPVTVTFQGQSRVLVR